MTRAQRCFAAAGVLLIGNLMGCDDVLLYRYQSSECKQRGKAYAERVERLKRDALEGLRPGTTEDEVIRFFQKNEIPLSFDGDVATGTIYLKGCAPSGCGSDDALLGLRVKVNKDGTVISKAEVAAIYTDCL